MKKKAPPGGGGLPPEAGDDSSCPSEDMATVVEVPKRPRRKKDSPKKDSELNSLRNILETLPTVESKDRPEKKNPDDRIGEKLGRYVVVETVGIGGMGVVYKAFDPKLDRRVALKLLTAEASGSESEDTQGSSSAQSRLLREAQALARLSHPNVISVFDVGVVDSEIFVAMEFVEGSTVKEWVKEERSLFEIIEVFRAAGKGLAAAHDVDLIHRDFKPANVIGGDDGRVRVLDFGLAREARAEESSGAGEAVKSGEEPEYDSGVSLSDSSLSVPITMAGTVVGTPPYMAPEQHRCERVDGRTDQFAFCVSLYEAIYGERPFRGRDLAEIKKVILRGVIPDSTSKFDVPNDLRKTIVRGLSVDADDRFPSMEALLSELPEERNHRQRWVVLGGGAMAIAVLAAALWMGGGQEPEVCGGGEKSLSRVWSTDRANAVKESLENHLGERGSDAFARAGGELERYSQEWLRMHRETCEATRVHGEQSEALLDLRMSCLDRKLDKVAAYIKNLSDLGTLKDLDLSLEKVHRLPDISECENSELLSEIEPMPTDAKLASRIASVRVSLDLLEAGVSQGASESSLAKARELVTEADKIAYRPLIAESLYTLATVADESSSDDVEMLYLRAAREASQAGDARLVAKIWIDMSYVVGVTLARYEAGKSLSFVAELAIQGAKMTRELEGERREKLGRILQEQGLYSDAELEMQEALRAFRSVHGERHPRIAETLSHLASMGYKGNTIQPSKSQKR